MQEILYGQVVTCLFKHKTSQIMFRWVTPEFWQEGLLGNSVKLFFAGLHFLMLMVYRQKN